MQGGTKLGHTLPHTCVFSHKTHARMRASRWRLCNTSRHVCVMCEHQMRILSDALEAWMLIGIQGFLNILRIDSCFGLHAGFES